MIGYTSGSEPTKTPHRIFIINDSASGCYTGIHSTGIQLTDSPTDTDTSYTDIVYELAIRTDPFEYIKEDLEKLCMAIDLTEHHHEQGRREYYRKKAIAKTITGMFLPYVLNRRSMVSRSGYGGLKGSRYRS